MKIQDEAFHEVSEDPRKQILLGFEYEKVLTLGKRARIEDLPSHVRSEFQVLSTERGGLLTLHSRGQLVIYPILNLREHSIGVREFIQNLHGVTSSFLTEMRVENHWDFENPQGLFTARGKIAFCGIRVKSGVSTHGISINIHNDLKEFSLFPACGKCDAEITSLEHERIESKGRMSLSEAFDLWSHHWSRSKLGSV